AYEAAISKRAFEIFSDVPADAYYEPAVTWAVKSKVTEGTSKTTFSPENGCTRGQVVTFLWRAAGSPEPTGKKNPFSDVKSGDYYYKAVLWAVEKGITKGTSATKFSPNATCTRGQIVTFLYRSEGSPAPTSAANPFGDVKDGDYFKDAVLWAVGKGITLGTTAKTFSPNATCTRGQVVTFLYRNAG
ncbi:MAG: S-layer homology domain-containing protein, partial [Clostridia bacterium]|nr:S-layer homology domain-containing protein [Clostridia bacterium]